MSWSISAIGKAPAVLKEVEEQSAQQKCSEPEETVRQSACHAIKAALAAQGENIVVRLEAYGSQREDYQTKVIRNQLTIRVEPIIGFLE
jgi:hypothetical protein